MIAQTTLFPVPAVSACRRCGRTLTDPISVAAGIGPVCRGYASGSDTMPDDQSTDCYCCPDLPSFAESGDVVVKRDGPGRAGQLHFNIPRRHVHHSPTGWEWGYLGSGPSDFALNVLALFIGPAPTPEPQPAEDAPHNVWFDWLERDVERVELWDGSIVQLPVWRLHHELKATVIARLPDAGGTLSGATIRAWLRERGAAAIDRA